jgi:hypothetical protein
MGIFLGALAHSMPQFGLPMMLVLPPSQILSGGTPPRESMPEIVRHVMLAAPNAHFVMPGSPPNLSRGRRELMTIERGSILQHVMGSRATSAERVRTIEFQSNIATRRAMMWFIRSISLILTAIFLQFIQGVGLAALLIAAAVGYFRAPYWSVPIMATVFGIGVDWLPFEHVELLEKASTSSQRGGFLVIVYFVIMAVGYLAGRYGRHYQEKRKKAARPAK